MRKYYILGIVIIGLSTLLFSCSTLEAQRGRGRIINAQTAPTTAPQQSSLGLITAPVPDGSSVAGALVQTVSSGSLAETAGVKPGDIITSLAGNNVASINDYYGALLTIERGRRRVVAFSIVVYRGGQSMTLEIKPTTSDQQDDPFSVSGKTAERSSLTDINVLKYAIIDPQTRVVTLIGKYDSKYKTGPIPYYDLMNDALASPYAWFSLEPSAETRTAVEQTESSISQDIDRMHSDSTYPVAWGHRLQNMLLTDPSLSLDREIFLKKGAKAFQVSNDEMLTILQSAENPNAVSSENMMPIIAKVMYGLGHNKAGAAISATDSLASFDALGLKSQAENVVAKSKSGQISQDRAELELTVLLESSILKDMGASETEVESKSSQVLSGNITAQDFENFWNERLTSMLVDTVGLKMFSGLTLSHRVLSKLYNVATPRMDLVFKDVPANSALGDVLFRADYALKSICTNPDTKDRIPGFQNEIEYMYDTSAKNGISIKDEAGAEAGHRLVPGEVKMRVSPSGTVISFDDAQVKIIGWLINSVGRGSSPEITKEIEACTEGYAAYLTDHYDDLAASYPELHRLREAEKLIALSRWAAANNYKIVVDKASDAKYSTPTTALGFWQAVFTADPQNLSLTVIAEGGASFGKDEGEAWVQSTPDSQVSSDVCKQLVTSAVFAESAADAAIGGNMDAARDFADKSARAMTGDIDFTKLPSLGTIPGIDQPAAAALLSNEAISAVDGNLKRIETAKISIQKASDLQATSPAEAANLQAQAETQKTQAEANLKGIHDAMDWLRNNPSKTSDVAVTIRGFGNVTPPSTVNASNTQPVTPTTPTTIQPTPSGDVKSEQRAKLVAELAQLQKELESTQDQFRKLSKAVQEDRTQLEDWEKVASDGMDRCGNVLYGFLMDASAGPLTERYQEMSKLADKLPNKPEDLMTNLKHIKNWLLTLKYTQSIKDADDAAEKEGKTLPQKLEMLRDEMNAVASATGLDKTVPGMVLKEGTNAVEIFCSVTEFRAAYNGIDQMDKNTDGYRQAVAALTERMQTIVAQIKSTQGSLANLN